MKGAKTTAQTLASGLLVIALQRLSTGELYQGSAAAAAAVGLFYIDEYLGIKQLPINSEDVLSLTDAIGDAAEERTRDIRNRRRR